MVARDCRELGITSTSQLDYPTVFGGLERLREEHGWGASTFRCHLSAFKSLHKHHQRTTAGDIQAAEGPTDNEPGEGSRAATLDEARRMLAVAWDMEQNDRRSRSSRTLYWLCMFAAGCREEDHWHWRWEHIRLDAEVPHVRWPKGIQKNKRTMHVALAPEMIRALREHRDAMRLLAETTPGVERLIRHQTTGRVERLSLPVHPDAPGAPVFICKPPRDVFRKDAQRAEIAYRDERERIFSPHSARKFFKTQMVLSGVPAELAEHLMRHSPKVAGRYVDPALEDQAAELAKFPRLLPESQPTVSKAPARKMATKPPKSLDSGGRNADAVGAEDDMPHPTNISNQGPHAKASAVASATSVIEGLGSSCFSAGALAHAAQSGGSALAAEMSASDVKALASTSVELCDVATRLMRLAMGLHQGGSRVPDRSPV